jgi:hypothetical protein
MTFVMVANYASPPVPVSQDAYVSFRGTRRSDFGTPTATTPLIFVDLDHDNAEALRSIPASFASQRRGLLLIRSPRIEGVEPKFFNSLLQLLERWDVDLPLSVLSQPVGEEPTITPVNGKVLDSGAAADYLARARAVELEALLEFGQAIWRPTTYHYRLVTGEHAGAYVKLGDAIREPRDADVLASWLHQHVGDRVGVLIDTGTLTPIAQSLQLAVSRAGGTLGEIGVLNLDPRTGTDFDAAVDVASGAGGRLVVVVSVSSTGSLLERLESVLARKGSSLEVPRIAVLVSKNPEARSGGPTEAWTPLPNQRPLVEVGARDAIGCELCRQPGRTTLIPINPFSFDGMLPSQLSPVVPDTRDPVENRPIWEAARRMNAVAVESAAHTAMRRHRAKKIPMGIVMDVGKLIRDAELRSKLCERVRKLQDTEGLSRNADLVLVAEHELGAAAFPEFWEELSPLLAPQAGNPRPFHVDEDFSPELLKAVRQAKDILVLGLGTVTGASLQRALVGVQDARKGMDDFEIHALVVHARPATALEWRTIRNSFGLSGKLPHLHFGWKTVLPDRSPLREEAALLRQLDLTDASPLDDAAKTFVTERMELCDRVIPDDDSGEASSSGSESASADGGSSDDPPILWGDLGEDDRLTPNSLYGKGLDAVTTYVAVASAMAAALGKEAGSVPELRVFEIAALSRSYYDPIILSCFFRWMRPHETFWGWTGSEAATTALHILERAEGKHRKLLVPEMLLASAQGKLTAEAVDVVVQVATSLLKDDSFAQERPALHVGLQLVRDAPNPLATEGLHPPTS